MDIASLLKVKIDFATSHVIFPHIIEAILAILLVVILAVRWPRIVAAVGSGPVWPLGIDKLRFFGTIAITVVYFLAMPAIGDRFPNTGLGFYFASIPYVLAISVLYLHDWRPRPLAYALANAVIAPTIVWYVLANVFNISLP
jgi:hypothetical protein